MCDIIHIMGNYLGSSTNRFTELLGNEFELWMVDQDAYVKYKTSDPYSMILFYSDINSRNEFIERMYNYNRYSDNYKYYSCNINILTELGYNNTICYSTIHEKCNGMCLVYYQNGKPVSYNSICYNDGTNDILNNSPYYPNYIIPNVVGDHGLVFVDVYMNSNHQIIGIFTSPQKGNDFEKSLTNDELKNIKIMRIPVNTVFS